MAISGRKLRRAIVRPFRRIFGRSVPFVYNGSYVFDLPGNLADPRRGENVLTFLASEGLIRRGSLCWGRPVSFLQLCRVHDPQYLESLNQSGSLARILGVAIADADEDRIFDLQRAMVGGTIKAAHLATDGNNLVFHLGGGLHHAHRDRGGGFCALNDVATAIAELRDDGFDERILIVDLDLHDGDGNRTIFKDDSSVHTFSIHNRHWVETDGVETTSVELGSGVDDHRYLEAIKLRLAALVERFRPALVFYLAGCDPAHDDALGDWQISDAGMLARDRLVIETLRQHPSGVSKRASIVVLLAGGYGSRAWCYTARFAAWAITGRELEVPTTQEITLRRFRYLSGLIDRDELTDSGTSTSDDSFGLTDDDVYGALLGGGGGGAGAQDDRFLGYYTRHGIELALERYGFLARLRGLGFEHPTVEFAIDSPTGQTLKIYGDADRKELVSELRARIDRGSIPGMSMLKVEWLMLQNPRKSFPPHRPGLPGQKHPGLGMLRDAVALLVMICHRLELDGVLFRAAHYHVAAQNHRLHRFFYPEEAARFEALQHTIGHLPLHLATRAAADGSLVDSTTGEPWRWQPATLVLPVSDRLLERFESDIYRNDLEAARESSALHLADAAGE